MKDKGLYITKCIAVFLLAVGFVTYICFVAVPQYEIRDHEGYLGGAIALAGYISFVVLMNLVKETLLSRELKDKIYIVSILNVALGIVCVRTILFYHARLYVISLLLFVMLPFSIVCIHFLNSKIKGGNKAFTYYKTLICISGILAIASTIIRGRYIFKPVIMLTMLALCLVIVLDRLSNNSEYFPYDIIGWTKEVKKAFFTKVRVATVILISLVTLYFLLAPLELYVGNMLSFSFGYATFVPMFIILGIVFCVVGASIISLLTSKTYKLVCIMLAIFSLLSYVQYMFMNTKLMEEDGARLRLDTMGIYPTINVVVWITAFVILALVLICLKEKWSVVILGACGFIAAIQAVAVVSLIITCINSPAPRYYQLSGDVEFSVAKNENVIVLMPDTFSRGRLQELLDYDPDGNYMDMFKDFTFYDHMYSECFPTLPSINHLLTDSEIMDAEEAIDTGLSSERVQWQKEAWESEKCSSFFDEIKKNGYAFYMNITTPCELLAAYDDVLGKIDNVEYAESNVNRAELSKMLLSMSAYSCLPYVMKPPFEYFSWDFAALEQYEGKISAYKNEEFYSEVCKGITVDESTDKKVHVINWHGFHIEFTNDEFCNPVPPELIGTVSDAQNAKGVMLCISTYFEKLKEIGRYDDCTIIVMGDHGDRYKHDGCVFVKLPNEHHDSVVLDHSEYVYSDFRATILDLIGSEEHEKYGSSWIETRK